MITKTQHFLDYSLNKKYIILNHLLETLCYKTKYLCYQAVLLVFQSNPKHFEKMYKIFYIKIEFIFLAKFFQEINLFIYSKVVFSLCNNSLNTSLVQVFQTTVCQQDNLSHFQFDWLKVLKLILPWIKKISATKLVRTPFDVMVSITFNLYSVRIMNTIISNT